VRFAAVDRRHANSDIGPIVRYDTDLYAYSVLVPHLDLRRRRVRGVAGLALRR
jgi:hypothetical protein